MSAGYKVILDDIASMSGKFSEESGQVAKQSGDLKVKPVATGDAELDGMLAAALTTLQGLNNGVVNKLKAHSKTLHDCHDAYHSTDSDHARLLDAMMNAAGKG
ncbi:DUF6317 family protein [Streptomyces sp. NPDC054933]